MPEITVVITAYNLESLLPGCFEELLGQSFQDFNVLVVDDCSKDATAAVIRRYAQAHPERIRALYLQENLGSPAKTRNYAMDSGLIDGTYTVFLDGDDSIQPDFLEKLYTAAKQADADMAVCAYDRLEAETGHVLCREMQGFPRELSLPPRDDTLSFVNTSLWNKLIRTACIGDTRIPDFKVGEDLAFLYRLYRKCRKIVFLEDILIHYRVRGVSVISNTSEETIHSFALELEQQIREAEGSFRQVLGLTAFIHIGVSMALRAKDNPKICLGKHLRWTREYLKRNGLLRGAGYLGLKTLAGRGVKGLGVWGCRLLYRVHGMGLFLAVYGAATRLLHIDIKF